MLFCVLIIAFMAVKGLCLVSSFKKKIAGLAKLGTIDESQT